MKRTGFHTLKDKGNIEEIKRHGPYRCERDDAWLGFGYYFWDSNIEWAHWWGKCACNNKYIICESSLVIDERCFDLVGDPNHQRELIEVFKLLMSIGEFNSNRAVTVASVIEYLKQKGLFDYDSIRSQHFSRDDTKVNYNPIRPEYTFFGQKIQICLIKTNNLALQTFKVVFPEEYVEQ